MTETVDTKAETENNSEDSPNYEALASEIGWSPKEKFRGKPETWVDAETYYKKGEFVLPIVKQQRDEAKKDAAEVRNELAEMKKAMTDFQKMTEAAAERQVKEQIAALKDARAAAVAAGDDKAFKQADDAIDDLKEQVKPPKVEAKPAPVDPDFEDWLDKNKWYRDDPKKKKLADEYGIYYSNVDGLRGKALYNAVADKMASLDDERSGTERAGPQRGGKASSTGPKGKTFDNLLPEYKQAFARFERNGIKMTKEQYVSKCDSDAWGA